MICNSHQTPKIKYEIYHNNNMKYGKARLLLPNQQM